MSGLIYHWSLLTALLSLCSTIPSLNALQAAGASDAPAARVLAAGRRKVTPEEEMPVGRAMEAMMHCRRHNKLTNTG
jgi:hypothetical protein